MDWEIVTNSDLRIEEDWEFFYACAPYDVVPENRTYTSIKCVTRVGDYYIKGYWGKPVFIGKKPEQVIILQGRWRRPTKAPEIKEAPTPPKPETEGDKLMRFFFG